MAELKESNYEEWAKTKNVTLEYYLNKGNNIEIANQLLSKRQSTFSLEKCIKNQGEGTKRWEEKQTKWINSLSEKNKY